MGAFERLYIGMSEEESVQVTDQLVYDLADISGNYNPICVSEDFASKTKFGRRLASSLVFEALISKLVGMKLPGAGAVFINLNIDFIKPVHIGTEITAKGTITELYPGKNQMNIEILCSNESGDLVAKCRTKVLYPDAE